MNLSELYKVAFYLGKRIYGLAQIAKSSCFILSFYLMKLVISKIYRF